MKIKNILITGGAGFLGQHLIEKLCTTYKNRLNITVIDKKSNPFPYINIHKYKNVKAHYNVDITDLASIKDYFNNQDMVYHLAGLVSFYKADRRSLYNVNVLGTENVLKTSLQNNIKKVVHISSVAGIGYKDDPYVPADETLEFDWTTVKNKYYMLSKHQSELRAQYYSTRGLPVIVINPGLMYGPGDYFNSIKLIKSIYNNKLNIIPPGGTNVVDVRDVAEGLLTLLTKNIFSGQYILGGYNYTFMQITDTIAQCLEKNNFSPKILSHKYKKIINPLVNFLETVVPVKLPVSYDLVDSGFKYRYFSSDRAKKELKYKIVISFNKTINDTLKWYKQIGLEDF